MSNDKLTAITIRTDALDEAPEKLLLAHGEAVIYSSRSPAKYAPNEDALAVIPIDSESSVFVVADGMGGMPAGEQASKIVIETLIDALQDKELDRRTAILNGIEGANKQILETKTGAGTTTIVAEINRNTFRTYHAGDSVAIVTTRHGNIKYETISHSPIGYALACGVADPEQAMLHQERNLISNYVGTNEMHITVGPIIELAPLDTIMLASDAIPDNLYTEEVCEYIREGSLLDSVNEMLAEANKYMLEITPGRHCHPDDCTLICFRQNT